MDCAFSHTIACDAATFWQLFLDPEYNEQRHRVGLDFPLYEVLEFEKRPDGSASRRLLLEPRLRIPAMLHKLVGNSARSEESGSFDPARQRFIWQVKMLGLGDKVDLGGEIWLEGSGPRVERHVRCAIKARVLGLGGFIESFIAKGVRDNYQKAADFTNRWLVEQAARSLPGEQA